MKVRLVMAVMRNLSGVPEIALEIIRNAPRDRIGIVGLSRQLIRMDLIGHEVEASNIVTRLIERGLVTYDKNRDLLKIVAKDEKKEGVPSAEQTKNGHVKTSATGVVGNYCEEAVDIPKISHYAILEFNCTSNQGRRAISYLWFIDQVSWEKAIRVRIARNDKNFVPIVVKPAKVEVEVSIKIP